MFDVCFIGVGRVGSLALKYFLEIRPDTRVLAIDSNPSRGEVVSRINRDIVFESTSSVNEAVSKTRGCKIAVVALPSSIAYRYVYELIRSSINVVDVSYIEEDPYTLEETALRNRVFYIPDAGFAPGFSNLYVGYVNSIEEYLDEVAIYVGGIPVKPVEPISYEVTWNPVDLLEEYTRLARVVVENRVERVDPLDKIVSVEIPGIGVFEGFYSDGLRTLIRNIRAWNMCEVTIRHPGHLNAIKLLRKLGFLDKNELSIDNIVVKPIEYTARILEYKLRQTVPDMAIMYIVVKTKKKIYKCLSRLIGLVGESATATYTALVLAKTIDIALGELEPGVQPLETLHRFYNEFRKYLLSKRVEFLDEYV